MSVSFIALPELVQFYVSFLKTLLMNIVILRHIRSDNGITYLSFNDVLEIYIWIYSTIET